MGKKRIYFLCIMLSVVCGLSFFPLFKTVREIGPFSQGAVQVSSHKIPLSSTLQYKFFERPFTPDQNETLINDHVSWNDFSGNTIHFGYQRGYLGLKLLLKNESDLPVSALFEIGWPFLNNLHFYSLSVDELTFARSASPMFTSQPMADYRHPVYRLDFAPGESRQVYLGLETAVKFIVPIKIWEINDFERYRYVQHFWYGCFFAAMVVMLFYNFILGIYTRDRSYLFYCLYVLSVIFYVVTFSGLGARYFWPESDWMIQHSFGVSSSFSFFCVVLFMRSILELDRYGGGALLLNRSLGWIWFFIVVGHVFTSHPIWLLLEDLTAIFSCPAGLGLTIYLWYKGNVSAKYLTIAWSVLIVATLVLMLGLTGITPYRPESLYIQMVGFIIEIILLSLALAERINRERSEKEAARKEALAYSQRVAEAQHREMRIQRKMLEMKEQLTKDLEVRVENRTQELYSALEELEKVNRKLEKLTITDPLTQIANRRYYEDILSKELRRAQRAKADLTLLVVDIDYFKLVNDTFGHRAGDLCLVKVAELIQENLTRASDFVARYGGEEFVIILPDADEKQAFVVAEKIRLACEKSVIDWQAEPICFTVSLGGSCLGDGTVCSGADLFHSADIQLYKAKEEGRNRVCIAQFK